MKRRSSSCVLVLFAVLSITGLGAPSDPKDCLESDVLISVRSSSVAQPTVLSYKQATDICQGIEPKGLQPETNKPWVNWARNSVQYLANRPGQTGQQKARLWRTSLSPAIQALYQPLPASMKPGPQWTSQEVPIPDHRFYAFLGHQGEALIFLPDGRVYRADLKRVTGRVMGADIAFYGGYLQNDLDAATITSSPFFKLVTPLVH